MDSRLKIDSKSKSISKDSKRIQAKGWFLTYPRCSVSKEELMSFLKEMPRYDSCVVCQEKHEDGEFHLHAFMKFTTKVYWSPIKFDFTSNGITYHGNYQVAKSFRAVERYIQKDGNFISDNVNVEKFVTKYKSSQMLKMPIHELFENDHLHFRYYKTLVEAQNLHILHSLKDFESVDVRGIWIYGPPGTGKSTYAREFLKKNCSSFYEKQQNKWWDGYVGQEGVLLDDFDTPCLGHYLKIWMDRYSCKGELKGSTCLLQHKLFVVTSNMEIEQIWNKDEIDISIGLAIRRRCKIVNMTKLGVADWCSSIDNNIKLDIIENNKPICFK